MDGLDRVLDAMEAVLKIRKSFEKQMDHSQLDHGLGVSGMDLIVAIEAARKRQPRKSTFDDPSLGQDHELSSITSFDDFHRGGKHGRRPGDQFAGRAAVGKHLPDIRSPTKQPDQYGARPDTILDAGRMDDPGENEAHRIYGKVLLHSWVFLPAS